MLMIKRNDVYTRECKNALKVKIDGTAPIHCLVLAVISRTSSLETLSIYPQRT